MLDQAFKADLVGVPTGYRNAFCGVIELGFLHLVDVVNQSSQLIGCEFSGKLSVFTSAAKCSMPGCRA